MPTTYKVLGQLNPSANTATTLYTVPSATSAVCSTLTICNQAGANIFYDVAIRPAGETLAAKHYIAKTSGCVVNDSVMLTLGVTLAATDVVTVFSTGANTSFNLFGSEIS
jgi:hypothetical protein